jgi:hypothetical protein
VDYFFFQRVEEEIAGIRLTLESLKKTWEGVIRSINIDEFTATFRQWLNRCNKYIRLNGGYVKKF